MNAPQVEVSGLVVDGPHEALLRDVSFVAPAGEVTVVPLDSGPAVAALALAVAGRIRVAHGSVTAYGSGDRDLLQAITRVVDADDVTAPEHALRVRAVVAEELALAEQPASRRHVTAVLEAAGLADRARDRWDSVDAGRRTRLLLDLAVRAPGARVVVLAGPDRHGGDPGDWLRASYTAAAAGVTVIVICTPATAALLVHGDRS